MTYREMLEAIALSDRETAETAEITNRAMQGLEPFATIDAQDGGRPRARDIGRAPFGTGV